VRRCDVAGGDDSVGSDLSCFAMYEAFMKHSKTGDCVVHAIRRETGETTLTRHLRLIQRIASSSRVRCCPGSTRPAPFRDRVWRNWTDRSQWFTKALKSRLYVARAMCACLASPRKLNEAHRASPRCNNSQTIVMLFTTFSTPAVPHAEFHACSRSVQVSTSPVKVTSEPSTAT